MGEAYEDIARVLSRANDKAQALAMLERLAAKDLGIAQAQMALAAAAAAAEAVDKATGHALAALELQPEMGILLPCNVVVEGNADGVGCRIHVTEPEALFSLVEDPRIAPVMADVRDRLMRVADALAAET